MGAGWAAGTFFWEFNPFSMSLNFFHAFGELHEFHDHCLGTVYAIGWAVRKELYCVFLVLHILLLLFPLLSY